jgi:hypothetical protein
MITREQLKKEIDNLPDSLLEELYRLLKASILSKKSTGKVIKLRNFHGRLDHSDIRKEAYE